MLYSVKFGAISENSAARVPARTIEPGEFPIFFQVAA